MNNFGYENGDIVPVDATNEELQAAGVFLNEADLPSFSASLIQELDLPSEQKDLIKGLAYLASSDIMRLALMEIVDADRP
jgi:hypothetical protein